MSHAAVTPLDEPHLSASTVAHYLRRHPGFFADHLELLELMNVPHPSGAAVSLVTRQLDLLREKNRRLLKQFDGFVQIARDNDALYQRLHQLTLTLIDASSLGDLLASLDWGLHQYFDVDYVAVRLLGPVRDDSVTNLYVPEDSAAAAWCAAMLARPEPVCGKPDPESAGFLFGKPAPAVASHAMAVLQHAGVQGLFAIGSRDTERFQADMGVMLLVQTSEILAARLAALLNPPD